MPRLKVRKNWYVGLNPDPINRSADVGDGGDDIYRLLKVGAVGVLGVCCGCAGVLVCWGAGQEPQRHGCTCCHCCVWQASIGWHQLPQQGRGWLLLLSVQ